MIVRRFTSRGAPRAPDVTLSRGDSSRVSTDRRAESRALWNALGNGFSQAFEIVLVPALFGLFGWWVDGLTGTRPALFIVFLTLGVIGILARTYYTYAVRMAAQERDKPWTRSRP